MPACPCDLGRVQEGVGPLSHLLFGDPVYRFHPVRLIGNLLAWYETKLRKIGPDGKFGGIILVLILLGSALLIFLSISHFLASLHWSLSWFWSVYLGWSFLALRDLLVHAKKTKIKQRRNHTII